MSNFESKNFALEPWITDPSKRRQVKLKIGSVKPRDFKIQNLNILQIALVHNVWISRKIEIFSKKDRLNQKISWRVKRDTYWAKWPSGFKFVQLKRFKIFNIFFVTKNRLTHGWLKTDSKQIYILTRYSLISTDQQKALFFKRSFLRESKLTER